MPELPEVETIRRGLEKHVVGYTIDDIEVRLAKQFKGDTSKAIGGKITQIRRFGKGLVIDLDNGYSLAIHVKMTGQLVFRRVPRVAQVPQVSRAENNVGELPNKYTHGIFTLRHSGDERSEESRINYNKDSGRTSFARMTDKAAYLYYNDLRQFGWIHVVETEKIPEVPFFKALGPEPLNNLTMQQFTNILKAVKTPIKILLMDQAKIAGIGNIYANDALYRAKINPLRPANALSHNETAGLFGAIEEVLRKGIEVGGASEWNYVDVLGGKGQYQNFFQVYGKEGEACTRCKTEIIRIKQGGRSTFYCPVCQK
jgi:formamidopyrimidine-DNA glycosylase